MTTLLEQVKAGHLPRHVAIIMDGNGRWAEARRLPRAAGHSAGARAAERIIRCAGSKLAVPYITLFAFSSENWARPRAEVACLMDLLHDALAARIDELAEAGVRLRVIGDLDRVPPALRDDVREAVARTAGNVRLHLTVALSYGARDEIARAARAAARDARSGRLDPERLDEASFAKYLETADLPDPDLVIRTGGEARLSNFLLWQAAYAELYFARVMWPDFSPAEFVRALADYQRRTRRFGTVEVTPT
jgi:undecaprenyl diphosphate synthase